MDISILQTFSFYWPLSLKGVEGHIIRVCIRLSELVSDISFSKVIDFKNRYSCLCDEEWMVLNITSKFEEVCYLLW